MDDPPSLPGHNILGVPAVDNDTTSNQTDTKVQKNNRRMKKHKKKQNAAHQIKKGSTCDLTATEEDSSSPSQNLQRNLEKCSAGPQHEKQSRVKSISPGKQAEEKMFPQLTCDQSTQTEPLQIASVQTQCTQTLPVQDTCGPPTESRSTQTAQTSFSLHQAYWGKSFTDDQRQSDDAPKHKDSQLTLISWNIDGLDMENVHDRVKGLLSILGKHSVISASPVQRSMEISFSVSEETRAHRTQQMLHRADVVLIQEFIPPYFDTLKKIMKDYEFLQGSDEGYFSGILVKKDRLKTLQSNIVKYPTTEMKRNLLIATLDFFGHPLCVMTSHLESCKSGSQERLNQLRRVWKWMKDAPEDHTVIFGGDTNLGDWEVKKLGGLPEGISDVWEVLGQPMESRYTWDTSINDNKDIPSSVGLRFDRIFHRAAIKGEQLLPESMVLIGLKKLKCDYFISDHWGILCTFTHVASEEQ